MIAKKILSWLKKNIWDILFSITIIILAALGFKKLTQPKKTLAEKFIEKDIDEKEKEIKVIDKTLEDYKQQYNELSDEKQKVKDNYDRQKTIYDKQLSDIDSQIENVQKEKHDKKNVTLEDALDHIKNILEEDNDD